MTTKQANRLLSYIPYGANVALASEEGEPIVGAFAVQTLVEGETVVNVRTKKGMAGIRLEDLFCITVHMDT